MEKKKLLLVAVSVGVFLVIVVSAAILVFKPGSSAVSEMTYRQINSGEPVRPASTDAAELVRDNTFLGLQDPAAASPIQENRIAANGDAITDSAGTRTITVPKPSAAAVPDTPARPRPVQAAPVKPAQSAPAKPAAAVPAAPKRSFHDFWVQAGSFSTRERADGVKHILDDKGIAAVITNQEINGSTYYRVRVGPYTSQNEADYWLAMIKSIDGFQDSQIWESQSLR